MKEGRLRARDGLTLSLLIFPAAKPRAVVQLVHGAKEHKERYIPFAEYLSEQGFTVVVSDLRGHGASVSGDWPLGHMEGSKGLVADQLLIRRAIERRWPDLPVFLFGHSFGSCIARELLMCADDRYGALCMTGTACWQPLSIYGMLRRPDIRRHYGNRERAPLCERFGDGGDISWVAADPAVVAAFGADPLCCGYLYDNEAVMTLWEADWYLKRYGCYRRQNPQIPILSVAGKEDFMTGGALGLSDTVHTLRRAGYRNVMSERVAGMKHEVLNEKDRELVWKRIAAFFEEAAERITDVIS